jgi:hypothetical protein
MADSYRPSAGAVFLSTRHPQPFIWSAVVFGALGAVALAFVRPIAAGLVLFAVSAFWGSLLLGVGIWSRHHPDEAGRQVEREQAQRDKRFLEHPARWLALFPPFAAVNAALRLHSTSHDPHSGASWVWSAVGGYLFGLVLIGVLIESARKRHAAHSASAKSGRQAVSSGSAR